VTSLKGVASSHGLRFGGSDRGLVYSFCERILSEANDVCHDGNTLLDTEDINILVVLRMNQEFMQHMRRIYPKLCGQNFNGLLGEVALGMKLNPLQTLENTSKRESNVFLIEVETSQIFVG